MRVIEHFLKGKRSDPSLCEDGLLIKENLVAVVDGVTAKGQRLWDGRTGGSRAKELILAELRGNVETLSPEELLNCLDQCLRTCYERELSEWIPEEQPRASLILYNGLAREVWSYGDCMCRIGDRICRHEKQVDLENAAVRAEVLRSALRQGTSVEELRRHDVGRMAIRERLHRQLELENKPDGYPVLNGRGICLPLLKRYPVPQGTEVVLATDGYLSPAETLAEAENALRHALQTDPLCLFTTKGWEPDNDSFDDRCYCRLIGE